MAEWRDIVIINVDFLNQINELANQQLSQGRVDPILDLILF